MMANFWFNFFLVVSYLGIGIVCAMPAKGKKSDFSSPLGFLIGKLIVVIFWPGMMLSLVVLKIILFVKRIGQ